MDASIYFEDADNSPSYFNDFTSNISRPRTGSVKYSASPATKDNPYRKLSGSERKYSSRHIDPAHQSSNRRGELLQQKKYPFWIEKNNHFTAYLLKIYFSVLSPKIHPADRLSSQEASRSRAASVARDSGARRRKSSVWGEVPEVCEDPGSAAPVSRASSADPEETEEEVEALNKKPVRNRCGNMHLTSGQLIVCMKDKSRSGPV